MMSYITSRTVSSDKTLFQISILRKVFEIFFIDELQDIKAVFVLTWILMLWCEAVVDGDDDGGDFLSESLAKVVEGF